MSDQQFRQLLNKLGLSWDGYRKVRRGVKKRICRHMQQLGCRTMKEYFFALDQSKDARQDCERLMTVSISRFFRDPTFWESLEDDVLANLATKDRRAAEEVLLRVRPRIQRAIRMMVGNDRDYDDLLSQVCLQVLESVGRYKGTGSLQAWAGRITFHVVVKHNKRRQMVDREGFRYRDV